MIKEVFFWLLLLTLWKGNFSNPSCPKLNPGMINVHLVCHTHDDVGWLKTMDQYFYGAEKRITWVGVQYIIDSIVPSLLRDPSRKFIYVESAFFWRWWNEQGDHMKNTVKGLVERGQLEFISGGWSMNDEATVHYNDIIDQMTIGLVWLNETFGPAATPRITWQIDPFGHSKEQASLFAQMGMDGLFFGRLDYDDKRNRWKTHQMEMVWKGSNSLGEDAWLFTGVLPNGYSPPRGFCFDLLCADDPIMDDPNLEDYNKHKMVDKFLSAVADQKTGYTTSNLIMTMGEDFHYVYAEAWYKNLDKLIKYVNERQVNGSNVNLVYSTPSCYLDALHDADMEWPTKADDFFPYASDPHSFWTGYFTSRPTMKGYVRQSNNLLQAVKQMAALTGIERGPAIDTLSRAMGVAQHHDAITGTAKQHVTDDYYKRLSIGVDATSPILTEGFKMMTQSENSIPGVYEFQLCPLLNISVCPQTETSKSFVVNVYNPLARSRSSYVRLPVASPLDYKVTDDAGTQLETQIVPLPEQVLEIPGRKSAAKYELIFYAENLPALAVRQYLVSSSGGVVYRKIHRRFSSHRNPAIKKRGMSVALDSHSKKLKSISFTNGEGKLQEIKLSQDWLWYAGMKGNNVLPEHRASGAYIFRPDGEPHEFTDKVKVNSLYDGPLVAEIHQEWSSWVTQVLRIYKDKNYFEAEWLVGPIPVDDGIGKEVINRLQFEDMSTNKTFYTDANGREMQKRVKDHRNTWNLNSTEPVSQNYYPVTSRLILNSTNGRGKAALMNDRAQGGTSLSEGQMELMVHRRLLYDDAFGVGEPLNEKAYGKGLVARGRHLLLHSDFANANCDFGCQHRSLGEELLLQPLITFSSPSSFSITPESKKEKSPLASPLPSNMRLLTLEPWGNGEWLLRLENFYEEGESSLSGTSTVDIQNLFADWSITDIQEVTLGANQLKKDNIRLKWKTLPDDATKAPSNVPKGKESPMTYSFSPMQIRTFIVKVTKITKN